MASEDAAGLARKGVEVSRLEGSPLILLRAGGAKGRFVTMTTAETWALIETLEYAISLPDSPGTGGEGSAEK